MVYTVCTDNGNRSFHVSNLMIKRVYTLMREYGQYGQYSNEIVTKIV